MASTLHGVGDLRGAMSPHAFNPFFGTVVPFYTCHVGPRCTLLALLPFQSLISCQFSCIFIPQHRALQTAILVYLSSKYPL